jgi:hypothetical protein
MRTLMTTVALTATLALCGCPTDSATGGGGGDLECADYTNTRVTCTANPDVRLLTALQTLEAMKASFETQFATVTWMGGIAGIAIDRDGKIMDKGPMVGTAPLVMEMGSGWTGNFCTEQGAVDDALNYDTTDGKCTAVRSCLAVNCDAAVASAYAFPAVDSPAAIQAAFPGDPAGTLYNVSLVLGNGSFWTVSRMGITGQTFETKNVDSNSGAVIP